MFGFKKLFSKKPPKREDQWEHYFVTIGENPGSILFNDSISKRINSLPHTHAMMVEIALRESNDDGLTTPAEADRLNEIEDQIEAMLARDDGVFLGRITSNRTRWAMFLVHKHQLGLGRSLQAIATAAGYDAQVRTRLDPERSAYWEELYPDEDSRQSLTDLKVIARLGDHGDDPSIERKIDHLAYFPDQATAQMFVDWASGEGFFGFESRKVDEDIANGLPWSVTFHHTGTTHLNALSSQSIKLNRKAAELNGDYDGWGTTVVTAD